MSAHRAAFEAAAQAVLEGGDVLRRTVAADDDLLLHLVQRVEGVEELLLSSVLACQKLDVVDEQHINAPVAHTDFGRPVLDTIEATISFRMNFSEVTYATFALRSVLADRMTDRMHQVGALPRPTPP